MRKRQRKLKQRNQEPNTKKSSKDRAGASATSLTTNIEVGPASEESNAALTHNTIVELDHLNDNTATTALPGKDNGQDYKCCECFGTFKENISLGNRSEWA